MITPEQIEQAAREIEHFIFQTGAAIEGGVLRDILKEEAERVNQQQRKENNGTK